MDQQDPAGCSVNLPFTIIRRAKVASACGRYYLEIAGLIVATEGDPCREVYILANAPPSQDERRAFGEAGYWTKARLEFAARRINGELA